MSGIEELSTNQFDQAKEVQDQDRESDEIVEEEVLVYPSYSLQNSFISTIDHLPCDIIRSLWLIQSCNIKINTYKEELEKILEKYQLTSQISDDELSRIYNLKHLIIQLSNETIQEATTLNNQLITHKLYLHDEINQLSQIKDKKQEVTNVNNFKKYDQLKSQLRQHYMDHPLKSQIEAINEGKTTPKKISTTTKSGLKLILKLPKQDKVIKPKINGFSSSSAIVKQQNHPKLKTIIKPKLQNKEEPKKIKHIKKVETEVELKEELKENIEEAQKDEEIEQTYCFCHQPSFGDMISCDNEKSCPNGEWFHYKCVGLLNRVDALKYTTGKISWYCSDHCREIGEQDKLKKLEILKRKRKRKW
ncbi:hypothetical protein KGF54_003731 [Candida jiufengensis]|uniref:uncharacterized protein n=1 Tax=Candida jiufengensis TaxID=497108 RepID=UPI0022241B2B|nr:uncharacterized protein KGF54_003731 [Candida jiufengensis]KAI5952864.1 hypothetical protein KGF54_003731 [Candida jiufengensis]